MEQALNDPNFNPGGQLDRPDARMLQWEDGNQGGVGAAMPPFNWDQGFDIELTLENALKTKGFKLPVKDQGTSGSCGGQETSEYEGVLEGITTGSFEERSAKDVIAQTFILNPVTGAMLGSNFRDNSNLAVKYGIARESILPSYDHGLPPTDAFMNRPQDLTEESKADAKTARSKSYVYVPVNIDSVAQAMVASYGAGMLLNGSNNGTWLSANPKPPSGPAERTWGHFMYDGKAGLYDGKKQIKALQSWGKNVGEDGWQYFDEAWFISGGIRQIRTMVFDDLIPPPAKYKFTRNLTIGSRGIDVRFLQVFLNTHGAPLAYSGPGSLGQETSNFGSLTRQALAKFQKDHGIDPALGYFGPLTRTKINSL